MIKREDIKFKVGDRFVVEQRSYISDKLLETWDATLYKGDNLPNLVWKNNIKIDNYYLFVDHFGGNNDYKMILCWDDTISITGLNLESFKIHDNKFNLVSINGRKIEDIMNDDFQVGDKLKVTWGFSKVQHDIVVTDDNKTHCFSGKYGLVGDKFQNTWSPTGFNDLTIKSIESTKDKIKVLSINGVKVKAPVLKTVSKNTNITKGKNTMKSSYQIFEEVITQLTNDGVFFSSYDVTLVVRSKTKEFVGHDDVRAWVSDWVLYNTSNYTFTAVNVGAFTTNVYHKVGQSPAWSYSKDYIKNKYVNSTGNLVNALANKVAKTLKSKQVAKKVVPVSTVSTGAITNFYLNKDGRLAIPSRIAHKIGVQAGQKSTVNVYLTSYGKLVVTPEDWGGRHKRVGRVVTEDSGYIRIPKNAVKKKFSINDKIRGRIEKDHITFE